MSKSIKPEMLGKAIQEQLDLYHEDVLNRITGVFERAIQKLVKNTKATAPAESGEYRKHIAWKRIESGRGAVAFLWYVKGIFSRLTHLLVHGHATVNGGRTKADPFLVNALEEVLSECENEVAEVLKNG